MKQIHIDIAVDFSPTPGGRYEADSKYSGEEFRKKFLEPHLYQNKIVVVNLDNAVGFSTGFLEEAFGGVVRTFGPSISDKVIIEASVKPSRAKKAMQFINRAINNYYKLRYGHED